MSEKELLDLLDFSNVGTKDQVLDHAKQIADELLHNWCITSFTKSEHEILALEFYLIIPKHFEDDKKKGGATHGRDEQKRSGNFYVHTNKKNPDWSFPIFNRHGIDLTCGNFEKEIYGGILLRHLGGNGHNDGSGRALRVILRGHEGFETVPQGAPHARWSEEEKIKLQGLNNSPIFGGIVSLKPYSSNNKSAPVDALTRIGIAKTRFGNEKLRFVLRQN